MPSAGLRPHTFGEGGPWLCHQIRALPREKNVHISSRLLLGKSGEDYSFGFPQLPSSQQPWPGQRGTCIQCTSCAPSAAQHKGKKKDWGRPYNAQPGPCHPGDSTGKNASSCNPYILARQNHSNRNNWRGRKVANYGQRNFETPSVKRFASPYPWLGKSRHYYQIKVLFATFGVADAIVLMVLFNCQFCSKSP